MGCPNTAALHDYFKSKELECSLAAAAKAAAVKKYTAAASPVSDNSGKGAFKTEDKSKNKSKKGKEAETADEA